LVVVISHHVFHSGEFCVRAQGGKRGMRKDNLTAENAKAQSYSDE
jgi:hypothetical protein